jgi:hypothetical protein
MLGFSCRRFEGPRNRFFPGDIFLNYWGGKMAKIQLRINMAFFEATAAFSLISDRHGAFFPAKLRRRTDRGSCGREGPDAESQAPIRSVMIEVTATRPSPRMGRDRQPKNEQGVVDIVQQSPKPNAISKADRNLHRPAFILGDSWDRIRQAPEGSARYDVRECGCQQWPCRHSWHSVL